MKRFRYLRDPLFLACLALYFINRLIIKPYYPTPFSQFYFNDLICIPFWVPIMLFAMRISGLRRHDGPPASYEIIVPLLIWSYVFEAQAPHADAFRGIAFADPNDILCYAAGALIASVVWHSKRAPMAAENAPSAVTAAPPPALPPPPSPQASSRYRQVNGRPTNFSS